MIKTVLMVSAATLALTACGGEPAEPAHTAEPVSFPVVKSEGAPPAFQVTWVPPAKGSGNFEVCLTNDAAENGIKRVTIPDNVVMVSGGQLVASLRERGNNDTRV